MNIKTFTFDEYENCYFILNNYENKNLAILIESSTDGPITKITTNIVDLHKSMACVNNKPYILDFIEENGFAKPTGATVESGYNEYPIYEFDLDKLLEYSVDDRKFK